MSDEARRLLRHTVATLAYRGGKTIRDAPASLADFAAAPGARTPVQVLAHIGDLFDWALSLAQGQQKWNNASPLPWEQECARFHAVLAAFDARLAAPEELACPVESLFQGPVADALTHVGQIALLRRMAGCPIRAENYFQADIVVGRVSAEQTAPTREF